MANKVLVFWAAAIVAVAAMAAGAQQKAASAQKAPAAPQTNHSVAADTAAKPHAGRAAHPSADSTAHAAPRSARLLITTDPPEAAVKIDGEDYGLTPVEANGLDTGSHVVELSKSGYFRRKATVRLDTAAAELHFELNRPAALVVTSEPAGAQITIDGQDAGASPLQNDKLRPGEHQITAALDGYKTFETRVELESGGADTLRVTLEPNITAPPPEPEQTKKADNTNKRQWQSSTILIAFFVFIAVLIGVEKSSY